MSEAVNQHDRERQGDHSRLNISGRASDNRPSDGLQQIGLAPSPEI